MQRCVGVADIVGCPATDFVGKSINGWLAGRKKKGDRGPWCLRHAVVGAR